MRDFFSSLAERFQEADRQQRLYVLLAVVVAIVGLRYGASWLFEYRDQVKSDIRLSAQRLAGARKLVEREGEARARLAGVRARYGRELARLVPGDTPMRAAAGLQDRVSTAASNNGVRIQSTQVLKDEAVGPFRRVSLRVTASGEIRNLAGMLVGLEFGDPSVRIPFVELSRRGAVRVRGKKNAARTVSATFQVAAIMAAGEEMGAVAGASLDVPVVDADPDITLAASAAETPGDGAVAEGSAFGAPQDGTEGGELPADAGREEPGSLPAGTAAGAGEAATAEPPAAGARETGTGAPAAGAGAAATAGAPAAAPPQERKKAWEGMQRFQRSDWDAKGEGGKRGTFGRGDWKTGFGARGKKDTPVAPGQGDG